MADEKITVEWIGTATKMTQVLDRLEAKLDKQEKQLKKIGVTGKKSGTEAATGFNKLEQEFKEAEKALRKLDAGTAAFARQKRKVDELRQSLTRAKGAMAGAGAAVSGPLSRGVVQMAPLGASMLGFQAIVGAVVSELEKINKLKLEAATQTKTFEQALVDVGSNIGPEAIPEARDTILREAPKMGVTQEGLANLIGVAVSAGAKDTNEALKLSIAALKVTGGNAERAQPFVGGALDVASLAGSDNFEGALGQLLQVGSQVRATDPAQFAGNIGPGLAAATATGKNQEGATTERALEIAATISQILKDQEGSTTSTTLMQLFTRMESFSPVEKKTMLDGTKTKLTKAEIAEFRAAKTFDDRLALLQKNSNLGEQFLGLQKQGQGKVAVSEIIGQSKRAVEFENKAKQNITSIDAAVPRFEKQAEAVEMAAPHLLAVRRAEAARAAAEVTGMDDTAGAVLEIVQKGMSKVNLSGIDTGFFGTQGKILTDIQGEEMLGETDSIKLGIAALEEAKQQRKLFGVVPIGGQVSQEHISMLQTQIDVLRSLEETLKRQEAAQQQQQQQPQPARVIIPAMRPKQAPLPAVSAP